MPGGRSVPKPPILTIFVHAEFGQILPKKDPVAPFLAVRTRTTDPSFSPKWAEIREENARKWQFFLPTTTFPYWGGRRQSRRAEDVEFGGFCPHLGTDIPTGTPPNAAQKIRHPPKFWAFCPQSNPTSARFWPSFCPHPEPTSVRACGGPS